MVGVDAAPEARGVGRCNLCRHVFWRFRWGRAFDHMPGSFGGFWGVRAVPGIFGHFLGHFRLKARQFGDGILGK